MSIFWKTSDVAKEEARLAELHYLYNNGNITTSEYLNAINQLKQTTDGTTAKSNNGTNALDIVQLLLIVAVIGAGIYALKLIKQ